MTDRVDLESLLDDLIVRWRVPSNSTALEMVRALAAERDEAVRVLNDAVLFEIRCRSEHCKDCCCARLWQIVGPRKRDDGKGLIELVADLKAENERLRITLRTIITYGKSMHELPLAATTMTKIAEAALEADHD